MRAKRAVGLVAISTLFISVLVGAFGIPASAAVPELNVPSGALGGVVNVSATADREPYPFLQVGLVVGNVASVPAGQLDGIDPAPVLNLGGTVNLQVPTWGVTDQPATFVLMGCSANTKDTCTTALALTPRQIVQTNLASASIDLPSVPIFVPEEVVEITTNNPGGGEMVAALATSGAEQSLPDTGIEVWTEYGADFGEDTLAVRRCSALISDPAYCELVETAEITWIREFVTDHADEYGYGLAFVTTDPGIPATSVELTFTPHSLGLPYDLSWELRDADDVRVAGPVQLAQDSTSDTLTRAVSPIAHAVGGQLPDGDYNFVLSGSTRKGALTKPASQSVTVSVLNDPPVEVATIAVADRVQRPKDSARPTNTTAYYSVPALTDRPGDGARFAIKNATGTVVHQAQAAQPCKGYEGPNLCLTDGLSWDFRVPVGSNNTLKFAPGTYAVSATIPDQFGRSVPVSLGPLYVQKLATFTRVVKISPAKRVASARKQVSAKFKLPMPEVKESYYDLARTRVTIGFKGTSRQARDRRVSCATTAGTLKWRAFTALESSGERVCRLVNTSSFRGLPTRGVRVRALVSNRAELKVKWIKATYSFRGYVTPSS